MPGSLLFFLLLKQSGMKMRLVAAVFVLNPGHAFRVLDGASDDESENS